MSERTTKIVNDLSKAIHSVSGYPRDSVKSHVYTEGFLLAVVAELAADDSHVYTKVRQRIAAAEGKNQKKS